MKPAILVRLSPAARRPEARLLRLVTLRVALLLGIASVASLPTLHEDRPGPAQVALLRPIAPPVAFRQADFAGETPSADARYLADWIADSGDNAGSEFVLIDKRAARAYVFDAAAHLRGATPVLLGAALGDESVPGIGERPLAAVRPAEKTTPAGRFVAEAGRNLRAEDVVWVDYDAAVSMHRVRATNPAEHRLERLASPAIADKRISFGCINVPAAFYDRFVLPLFAQHPAPVYVLPDSRPLREVFPAYDAAARQRRAAQRASGDPCAECRVPPLSMR